jgi:hypothetical protein
MVEMSKEHLHQYTFEGVISCRKTPFSFAASIVPKHFASLEKINLQVIKCLYAEVTPHGLNGNRRWYAILASPYT